MVTVDTNNVVEFCSFNQASTAGEGATRITSDTTLVSSTITR